MCGIVGYIGHREAYPIVIKGLKRLEYRGYDSAGLMLYDGENLKISKTKGKVSDLEDKSNLDITTNGTIGIGHTRWATHGKPSKENAHPHSSAKVCVVHNGIIENYDKLKISLQKDNAQKTKSLKFLSETDTEVLPHLIDKHLSKTNAKQKGFIY